MDNNPLNIQEKDNGEILKSHSPTSLPIRREKDSLDDFEHLGLDSSPLQETLKGETAGVSLATRDLLGEIDNGLDSTAKVASKLVDDVFDPFKKEHFLDNKLHTTDSSMDSNLLELSDINHLEKQEHDNKMDKFLSELTSFAPPVPSHEPSPCQEEIKAQLDGFKSATQNFMDSEREALIEPPKSSPNNDIFDRYSFKEPEPEDNKKKTELPYDAFETSQKLVSELASTKDDFDVFKSDFKDAIEAELPIKSTFVEKQSAAAPVPEKPSQPSPEKSSIPHVEAPQPPTMVPQPFVDKVQEIKKEETKPSAIDVELKTKPAITDAEAIFKQMGLDAWFHPERLNPKVESLIYWRDPKKSGPVFGGVLIVLLALTYFSLISVVAYVSLLALTATISFRIYKNVLHAVQKTGDGHPFKDILEADLTVPQDKAKEIVEVAVAHINAAVTELRRLFLVEDLVDSIKFGVLLWCFTYLGAWFNGMTLVIISWVALFTLPKLYETNKTQIDANLDLVRSKVAEITSKVKAAIPIGKKNEEKKEQ